MPFLLICSLLGSGDFFFLSFFFYTSTIYFFTNWFCFDTSECENVLQFVSVFLLWIDSQWLIHSPTPTGWVLPVNKISPHLPWMLIDAINCENITFHIILCSLLWHIYVRKVPQLIPFKLYNPSTIWFCTLSWAHNKWAFTILLLSFHAGGCSDEGTERCTVQNMFG